jgi:hypothetical protein
VVVDRVVRVARLGAFPRQLSNDHDPEAKR